MRKLDLNEIDGDNPAGGLKLVRSDASTSLAKARRIAGECLRFVPMQFPGKARGQKSRTKARVLQVRTAASFSEPLPVTMKHIALATAPLLPQSVATHAADEWAVGTQENLALTRHLYPGVSRGEFRRAQVETRFAWRSQAKFSAAHSRGLPNGRSSKTKSRGETLEKAGSPNDEPPA
jgi:hypothetical protein